MSGNTFNFITAKIIKIYGYDFITLLPTENNSTGCTLLFFNVYCIKYPRAPCDSATAFFINTIKDPLAANIPAVPDGSGIPSLTVNTLLTLSIAVT